MLVKTDIHILEDAVCRNQKLTIENNSVGINTSIWFFGDETSSNEFIPIKSYTKSGKFKITYIGSANQFCADTSFAFITVDSVKAAFNTSDRYICSLPFQVVYTDQSINAIAWDWKLGGINHSNQQNPKITFSSTEILDKNNSAYLSDTLIVTSPLGCQDQLIIDSNIFISIPDIYFSPNSKLHPELMVGCAPLTIDFSDSSKNFNPTIHLL
jgi:PKD repeat protein